MLHRAGAPPPFFHLRDQIRGIQISFQPVFRKEENHQIAVFFRPAGILAQPADVPEMGNLSGQAVGEKRVQIRLDGGGELEGAEPLEKHFDAFRQLFQNGAAPSAAVGILGRHNQAPAVFSSRAEIVEQIVLVVIKFKNSPRGFQIPKMGVGDDVVYRVQIDLSFV